MKRIFLTVGTNTPFDRLLSAFDRWCEKKPDVKVFGQIGPTAYVPKNYAFKHFISPAEYRSELEACDLIVSHAGMGTILSALQYSKPIVVMPRKASMNETRNDHQLSTCKFLSKFDSIRVAWKEEDLAETIDRGYEDTVTDISDIQVSKNLLNAIQDLIDSVGSDCKVMCLASGGGHWVQLRRIMAELKSCELIQVTTDLGEAIKTTLKTSFHIIPDATRWSKFGLVRCASAILYLLFRVRPKVIISTGAAPGFFALMLGKLINAKTVWVDSIANAETLSLSGQKAGRFADIWLTQWPNVEEPNGPKYVGSVMGS
jgi:UDP-N-acetylglucosamine transferase subunit ALG13